MLDRWLYTATSLDGYNDGNKGIERTESEEDAVLRSSEIKLEQASGVDWLDNQHAPAIDIDLPCTLIPSSTEGHFHLYIDKPMSWNDYVKLLKVMVEVGIVEEGFYNQALANGKTFLRVRDKSNDPIPNVADTVATTNATTFAFNATGINFNAWIVEEPPEAEF